MGSGSSNPTCTHCGSTKSPLWRRGIHSEILCNACGLYWKHHGTYRPLALKVAAEKKVILPRLRPEEAAAILPSKRESNLRKLKATLDGGVINTTENTDNVTSVRKKVVPLKGKGGGVGKMGLHPTAFYIHSNSNNNHNNNGGGGGYRGEPVFPKELSPSTGTANVRLIPSDIRISADLNSTIIYSDSATSLMPSKQTLIPVKYIMYRGRLLFIGDHVAVRGDDSQIYFAVIHDFWMIPNGQKFFKLQWLLPKNRFALQIDGPKENIDPSFFTLGPMHTRSELIESIVDVFFSPQTSRKILDDSVTTTQAVVPNVTPTPSRSITPSSSSIRRSSWDESDDAFYLLGSGISTPRTTRNLPVPKKPHSDSEIEIHKPPISNENTNPIFTEVKSINDAAAVPGKLPPPPPPPPSQQQQRRPGFVTNILDDVEMAHFLCSLT